MMRGVGRVRKSIHQRWLAKGIGLGLQVEVFREFRKRFLGKRPALFKSAQWYFQQDNELVQNSILVTDYSTIKIGIHTVPQYPYSPDLALCDFWLFPKLRGCRYETIEEMKEAVTKAIDTLTQEDFHMAFLVLLERYNKCNEPKQTTSKGGSFMCVLSTKTKTYLLLIFSMSWTL